MMHTERRAMAVAMQLRQPEMSVQQIAWSLRMTPDLVREALAPARIAPKYPWHKPIFAVACAEEDLLKQLKRLSRCGEWRNEKHQEKWTFKMQRGLGSGVWARRVA